MIYMVTYDLNTPGQKYEQVLAVLDFIAEGKSYSFWQSSYLIKTDLSSEQILGKLQPYLDSNDKLLIIQVSDNYSAWLNDEQQDALRKIFRTPPV